MKSFSLGLYEMNSVKSQFNKSRRTESYKSLSHISLLAFWLKESYFPSLGLTYPPLKTKSHTQECKMA